MAEETFQLIDLETDYAFEFPYFPEQVRVSEAANWQPQDVTMGTKPLFYANGEPRLISLTDVILDNTEAGDPLTETLDSIRLFKTEMLDGRPPQPLLVVWGDNVYLCVMTAFDCEHIMFTPEGYCTRARVALEFMQIQEDGETVIVNEDET